MNAVTYKDEDDKRDEAFQLPKLRLDNVTLLSVDDVNINGSIELFSIILSQIQFGGVVLFSSKEHISQSRKCPFLRKCDPINSIFDYNKFLIKESHKYINTKYVMFVQRDGYPVNLSSWNNLYLEYDYIGAPWPNNMVGNGGFSIRSKKILEDASKFDDLDFSIPEDVTMCHPNFLRDKLCRLNNKFAPVEVARFFSVENNEWNGQLGFHGKHTYNLSKHHEEEFKHGVFC